MKKIISILLVVATFAGCSKDDTPNNGWDNVINGFEQTELSPIEVLKSADAWRPIKIYKYYDDSGKNGEKLCWDSESGGKETGDGDFLYAIAEDLVMYGGIALNEYRVNPDDGQKFYYAHYITDITTDKFKLYGPYGFTREVKVVGYDENSMVLEFYDPQATSRPYTRELIVRVNGAKGLNKYEDYIDLYDEEGNPYQRFDWVIDGKYPPNIKQVMIDAPYWKNAGMRRAYVRKGDDGINNTVYTTMSPNNMPYDGNVPSLFYQFEEERYVTYYKMTMPNSKMRKAVYDGNYIERMYILQYKDGLLAFTFDYQDVFRAGSEVDVYFLRPSNQEAFDEAVQQFGYEQ